MKNKKKGFSLIEVVMALAVISIGVLPILSMYPSALKMTVKATENEEWSRVTMSILDYVKSRGYKTLTSTTYSSLWSGDVSEKTYGPFIKNGTKYTESSFESDFLKSSNLFFVNTKGINLVDYKFSIYMEKVQPQTTSGGSIEVYGEYDLVNNKIVSTTTSSSIIYGIIKIREKNATSAQWNEERTRDVKFIITPIENWGD